MQNVDYRHCLEEAVQALDEMESKLFTAMVNLGFKGVYAELDGVHEVGEVVHFELAMFEDTGDTNLESLVELIRQVEITKTRMINLNGLENTVE